MSVLTSIAGFKSGVFVIDKITHASLIANRKNCLTIHGTLRRIVLSAQEHPFRKTWLELLTENLGRPATDQDISQLSDFVDLIHSKNAIE